MSRQFDGVDDSIMATVVACDTGSWTMAAWIFPISAGESSNGAVFRTNDLAASNIQVLRFDAAGGTLIGRQRYAPTFCQSTTSTTVPFSAWSCVFCAFRESDTTIRIFIGNLSTPVAEASYSLVFAGTAVRGSGGVDATIGNDASASQTFNGRIQEVHFDNTEWTLGQMEGFRLGYRPGNVGNTYRGLWPMNSPTASQIEDLSGRGANGTLTGAVVAEDAPVPMHF